MAYPRAWTPTIAPGPLGGCNRMIWGPGADPAEFYIKKYLFIPGHCTLHIAPLHAMEASAGGT